MKLHINRDQAPKVFGGVKFTLAAKVKLTEEELALVKKYKVAKEPLLVKSIVVPFTKRKFELNVTIGSLLFGETFRCNSIADILACEEEVRAACSTFKTYIETMAAFGGSEIVEYSMGNTVDIGTLESDSENGETDSEDSKLCEDPSPSAEVTDGTCPDCGYLNETTVGFCASCGVPLSWEEND